MSSQPLRGSKQSLCFAAIETLRLTLKYAQDVDELRAGIRSVINFLEKERDEFKKPKKNKK